ncbi:MAG: glucose-6-phosphate dehydrogenase [Candidatus Didemnitutus sp.]|nr:glucose-6-phosphate dehydrogenase [Candidatus Didemnitutus sp.]
MPDHDRHPFLHGLSKHRGAPPTVVVIFGASGDLTARKLVPAIYNLAVDGLLPADFFLIGFGRQPMPDTEFQQVAADAVREFSRREVQEDVWSRLAPRTLYVSGGYDEAAAYGRLSERIATIEKEIGQPLQTLFYISTPPSVFAPIIENLGASGLAARHVGQAHQSKVIIEKPFGKDLASAQSLNRTITAVFEESQVFRIDHYLGKETVQDLLVQRFANAIFEPLWNRNFVDHVQITVSEEVGVGTRAGYYEGSGALRDMMQNHTMQLLALTAMEPPVSLDAESIRNEKVKLLKAIQPLRLDATSGDVARAQYTEGLLGGNAVPGYLQEDGVAETSSTETYAALRLNINNWRWHGVPFYLRSGKRMARRVTEIAIRFKPAPGNIFAESERFQLAANTLAFQIQPDEGMSMILNAKIPGLETRTQPVKMNFKYATTFGSNTPEAYERLVLDAMIGDGTLFIRGDETERSWQLVTPILEHWQEQGRHGLDAYSAGSWGPPSSAALLAANRHTWREP